MKLNSLYRIFGPALLAVLSGCTNVQPYDYANYRAHRPRSILVLPPLNESTSVEGTYSYLSTVSRPLAELGYYVFPVAVIDQYLKANGLPTAREMHQIPLDKVRQIIGADAVLYVTLEKYGSKYEILNSVSTVAVKVSLVDTLSQTVLWDGEATVQHAANSSGNILVDLVAAAVEQVINSKTDAAHPVCRLVNQQLFFKDGRALPDGPYSPAYLSN